MWWWGTTTRHHHLFKHLVEASYGLANHRDMLQAAGNNIWRKKKSAQNNKERIRVNLFILSVENRLQNLFGNKLELVRQPL